MPSDDACPILVNARAGAPQPRARLEQIEQLLERYGLPAYVVPTRTHGEMQARLRELARTGAPTVAVAGGDGTIALAVQELAYTGTALAVLPLGTFNNFAAALNVPRDLHAALHLLREGTVIHADLGGVEGASRARYFTEAAGSGLFARFVAGYGTHGRKNPFTAFAAASRALLRHRSERMRVVLDGEVVDEGLSACIVANSYRFGAALPVAPGARVADGLLDVVLVRALELTEILPYARATWAQMLATLPKVEHRTAREVRLEAPGGMPVHVDDRALLRAPVTLRARPNALRVLVPRPHVAAASPRPDPGFAGAPPSRGGSGGDAS